MHQRIYPPWNLKGDGYIFVYRLPKEFLINNCFIPKEFQEKLFIGLSALIIVDYHSSNVGPYKEILFIPALFNFNGKKYYSISKIYVDSELSIFNGYQNWGIPKEFADFEFDNEKIKVYKNKEIFFEVETKDNSLIKIPFNSQLFNLSLIQEKDNNFYITDFFAKGLINNISASIKTVNQEYLPNLQNYKPLISFKINNFDMTFKETKIF